jgi:hypothetical protein
VDSVAPRAVGVAEAVCAAQRDPGALYRSA